MRVLDLFSGMLVPNNLIIVKEVVSVARKQVEGTRFIFGYIGGFSLGLERAGMQTVCFVEIDPFCQKVLRKHWPTVPIINDIREVTVERLREVITDTESEQTQSSEQGRFHAEPCGEDSGDTNIDLITAGVPCQPASCAGKRRGKDDDRWLWEETFPVIREFKPTWCIIENVRGLASLEGGLVFDTLLSTLEAIGYETVTFCIPACAVNAPHRRDRFWIIANNTGARLDGSASNGPTRTDSHAADTKHTTTTRYGQDSRGILSVTAPIRPNSCNQWEENWYSVALRTCVRGLDDGVSAGLAKHRVNKLKALGNAVVPQIPEIIGRAIMEVENS